jgi:hypothetical protein
VQNKLQVTDVRPCLAWQLETQQVRHNPDHDPHCWVFALLKAGAGQITDPTAFGFEVDSAGADRCEFYALSSAHFERYLMPDMFRPRETAL